MKYLIDAQLPRRLCHLMRDLGFDAIHTLDLTEQNRTKDCDINIISIHEQRVVVSKDSDFVDSLIISEKPFKLIQVSTGNIANNDLLKLFQENIHEMDKMLQSCRFIELNPAVFIIHQ